MDADVSSYPQLLKLPVCTYSVADIERDGDQNCQVVGCSRSMGQEKHYYRKFGVCEEHMKSPHIMVEGILSRFCQQCGRFHNIEAFDGTKRSCREMLLRHSNRRHSNKRPLSSSMRGLGQESSVATGERSSSVHDVSSSAISTAPPLSHSQVEQGFSLRPKSLQATPTKSSAVALSPSTSPISTQSQLAMHLQQQPALSSTAPAPDNLAEFMLSTSGMNVPSGHHAGCRPDNPMSTDRIPPGAAVQDLLASFLDSLEPPQLPSMPQGGENVSQRSTPCSKRSRRFSDNTSLSSLMPSSGGGWIMNLGDEQVSSQRSQRSNNSNGSLNMPPNVCDVLNKLSVADRERLCQWVSENVTDSSQEQQSHHRVQPGAGMGARQALRMTTSPAQMPGHVHDLSCGCVGDAVDLHMGSQCSDTGCHRMSGCGAVGGHRHAGHGCCDHAQGVTNSTLPFMAQSLLQAMHGQQTKQECHSHSCSCSHAHKPGMGPSTADMPAPNNVHTAAQQAWALAQSMYGMGAMPSGLTPQMALERMARYMIGGFRGEDSHADCGHASCQGPRCTHHHHGNTADGDSMFMHAALSTMNARPGAVSGPQQFVNGLSGGGHPGFRLSSQPGTEGKRFNQPAHGSCSSCSSCTAGRSITPQPGWDADTPAGQPDPVGPPAALSWMLQAADLEALTMFRSSANKEGKGVTQGSGHPWNGGDAPDSNPSSNNPFLPNHGMNTVTDNWNMQGANGSRPVLSTRALQEVQNFNMQRMLNSCIENRVDAPEGLPRGMEPFMDSEGYDPSNQLSGWTMAMNQVHPSFMQNPAAAAAAGLAMMGPR